MKRIRVLRLSQFVFAGALVGCWGHDHAPGDDHAHGDERKNGGDDYSHEHSHGDEQADEQVHGDHEGASEAVTIWGERTQLFVEFPALVVGEESPMAAHLTRLSDHLAIGQGSVVVELSGGGMPVERFEVSSPSVAGIFRPIAKPAHAGRRMLSVALDSADASEVHALGEFEVFGTRAAANAAVPAEGEDGGISFLLEQQWRVPFRIERVAARPMRASVPAFAELVQPGDGEAWVTAPRDGRVELVGGRLPQPGEEVEQGGVLFSLATAPNGDSDRASLDVAADQAAIRVEAAQREVGRLEPLVSAGVVPQRRLDEAGSELAAATAELRGARRRQSALAQSQRVGAGGDRVEIPSPLSGQVAELVVAPGTWVSAGDRLARVVERDRLMLQVQVPEAYLSELRDVAGVWFRLNTSGDVFEVPRSELVAVGTELNERRALPVSFSVSNVRRELFAGMHVEAHLVVAEPALALAIPAEAVVDDGGTDVVFVQTGGESFERRPVRLGLRDGDYVEVLAGLSAEDWIVSRGGPWVRRASTSTAEIGHGHAH